MKKLIGMAIVISILTSGCSTIVTSTETVKISCSEPDATIQINGGQTYQGRAEVLARKNKLLAISCYKPGYFPAQKTVSSSLSGTGLADLVGTFIIIVPAIGLFTPGAWKLDETDITLIMVKSSI